MWDPAHFGGVTSNVGARRVDRGSGARGDRGGKGTNNCGAVVKAMNSTAVLTKVRILRYESKF